MQTVGTVQDAASAAGYLGIGESAYFVDKLPLARSGIHQMGVRVAPGGQHRALVGVEVQLGLRELSAHLAETGYAVVFHQQPGVFHYSQAAHVLSGGAAPLLGLHAGQETNVGDKGFHSSGYLRRNSTDLAMCGYITTSWSINGTSLR